jgi:hypothetical protein
MFLSLCFSCVVGRSSMHWLLHSRPMVSPITFPLSTINTLLAPMHELLYAQPPPPTGVTASGEKISPRSLPLSALAGVPVLEYQITTEALLVTAINKTEK